MAISSHFEERHERKPQDEDFSSIGNANHLKTKRQMQGISPVTEVEVFHTQTDWDVPFDEFQSAGQDQI
jgi:hypothetical protein